MGNLIYLSTLRNCAELQALSSDGARCRRVGEGWRVGAAENKQNWRAGEGLGRPRSTLQNTQDGRGGGRGPGAGAGWVAPKSESCELNANSLKSAKRGGKVNDCECVQNRLYGIKYTENIKQMRHTTSEPLPCGPATTYLKNLTIGPNRR